MNEFPDLLPIESNGRVAGRVLGWFGVRVELAGIWIQRQADEVRWRRLRAIRRWGT